MAGAWWSATTACSAASRPSTASRPAIRGASGYNPLTSARVGGRHFVAVVMGGRSGASRDAEMARLVTGTSRKWWRAVPICSVAAARARRPASPSRSSHGARMTSVPSRSAPPPRARRRGRSSARRSAAPSAPPNGRSACRSCRSRFPRPFRSGGCTEPPPPPPRRWSRRAARACRPPAEPVRLASAEPRRDAPPTGQPIRLASAEPRREIQPTAPPARVASVGGQVMQWQVGPQSVQRDEPITTATTAQRAANAAAAVVAAPPAAPAPAREATPTGWVVADRRNDRRPKPSACSPRLCGTLGTALLVRPRRHRAGAARRLDALSRPPRRFRRPLRSRSRLPGPAAQRLRLHADPPLSPPADQLCRRSSVCISSESGEFSDAAAAECP